MDTQQKSLTDRATGHEIATFLAATAMELSETVAMFERTTSRITEHVMARGRDADQGLIVTLQDFDRLQQELATFSEVLGRAALKSGEFWSRAEGGPHPAEDLIAPITISDLKERFARRLRTATVECSAAQAEEEAVF
jgi:hypothetical protein